MVENQETQNMKLVVVGDGSVGKTCILVSYAKDEFPKKYVPTVFEQYTAKIQVGNKFVNLQLFDTAGQEEYAQLRNLAYPNTDVFLIIFSVIEPASFDNAINMWYKELQKDKPNIPKVFVGNKIDLRQEAMNDPEKTGKNAPVQFQQAQQKILELGCKYIECSALTQENLKKVFDEAIQKVLVTRESQKPKSKKKKSNKICEIF